MERRQRCKEEQRKREREASREGGGFDANKSIQQCREVEMRKKGEETET